MLFAAFVLLTSASCLASAQELQCHVRGECTGLYTGLTTEESYNDCLRACSGDCSWITYFENSNECFQFADCPSIAMSCSNCFSGQSQCLADSSFSFIMAIAGEGTDYDVESVDLTGGDGSCPQMANFPSAESGSVSTFMDGKAIVCGGYVTFGFYSNRCLYHDPITDVWIEIASMSTERAYAAAVQLSPTEWWITGGNNYLQTHDTTEIYTVGGGFTPYVNLPEAKVAHNIVRVNSTHYVMTGGSDFNRTAWMFDRTTEAWSLLPNLGEDRDRSQAGLVTYPDGRKAVMVAGGFSNTSEIFDLAEQTWSFGPDLPLEYLFYGATVQYDDTFLIVGGISSTGLLDSIYSFDPAADDWVELPQKLDKPRELFTAIAVPEAYVQCQ